MVHHQPKSCQFCGEVFTPHPKVGMRQIVCTSRECQRARKRANLKSFYLTDPGYNYDNVKRYRATHPNYQRRWRQKRKEKLKAFYAPTSSGIGQQSIPARLSVSPQRSEIQTELTSLKTKRTSQRVVRSREIQTELTLNFSVELSKLAGFLPT